MILIIMQDEFDIFWFTWFKIFDLIMYHASYAWFLIFVFFIFQIPNKFPQNEYMLCSASHKERMN